MNILFLFTLVLSIHNLDPRVSLIKHYKVKNKKKMFFVFQTHHYLYHLVVDEVEASLQGREG